MIEGLALLAVSLFSSATVTSTACLAGVAPVHVVHELGHDAAALAQGGVPWRPLAVWGDKWDETQAGFRTVARGGFVAQSWLAAATLDPCLVHANKQHQLVYAARAALAPAHAGDYDPARHRAWLGVLNVGLGAVLEGISYEANR